MSDIAPQLSLPEILINNTSCDSGTQTETFQQWPPTFFSYDNYVHELQRMTAQHPPFGKFLDSIRTLAHTTSGCAIGMWHLSIEELKEEYIKWQHSQNNASYAKAYAAKSHLESDANITDYDKQVLVAHIRRIDSTFVLKEDSQAPTNSM